MICLYDVNCCILSKYYKILDDVPSGLIVVVVVVHGVI